VFHCDETPCERALGLSRVAHRFWGHVPFEVIVAVELSGLNYPGRQRSML
jgi:hypothetical protein